MLLMWKCIFLSSYLQSLQLWSGVCHLAEVEGVDGPRLWDIDQAAVSPPQDGVVPQEDDPDEQQEQSCRETETRHNQVTTETATRWQTPVRTCRAWRDRCHREPGPASSGASLWPSSQRKWRWRGWRSGPQWSGTCDDIISSLWHHNTSTFTTWQPANSTWTM